MTGQLEYDSELLVSGLSGTPLLNLPIAALRQSWQRTAPAFATHHRAMVLDAYLPTR